MIKLGGIGMRINGFDFHKREKPPFGGSRRKRPLTTAAFVDCGGSREG